jgi:D-3-phosphoglycerate dehydrogenase
MAPIDPATLESLRGYLDVAYRLGRLTAGLHSGVRECRLFYRGEIAGRNTRVLTSVFAAGLLEGALDDEVNLVNAEVVLRERGIRVVEECRTEMGSFRSSMRVEVTVPSGEHSVTGTIFGESMPRLIAIDGYRLEAYLDGCLMIFTHHDVPGIIGSVGTVFGQHQVNIAQMAVGRAGDQPGGSAIGVLNLDCPPTEAALEAVRSLDSIQAATVVHLPEAGELPAWLQPR